MVRRQRREIGLELVHLGLRCDGLFIQHDYLRLKCVKVVRQTREGGVNQALDVRRRQRIGIDPLLPGI